MMFQREKHRFFRNFLGPSDVVIYEGKSKKVVYGRKRATMVMCVERELQIENPRNHAPETMAALRALLTGGTEVTPDPKRPNFYEIEDDSLVYYIHVLPASGKVLLLATWPSEAMLERMEKSA